MSAAGAAGLVTCVQHNCHVADARHAAEMTLCTYLLQMREYFRWEQGIALGAPLAREAVGAWMAEREALWERLAQEDYRPLPLPGAAGGLADPFDVEAVNAALAPWSLLYGAGLVARGRPVFFVADLHSHGRREELAVLQAGRERARTLLAPPAALGGGGSGPIVLRRESMARWCWERAEADAMHPRPGGALQAMLAHYGLESEFLAGLPRWLDDQCETAVWHEIGEHRLSRRWGERWSELRAAAGQASASTAQAARAEMLVRALRDQLADLGLTLPALLDRGEPGPLHAWFAGYEGLRQASFPALLAGYQAWRGGDGGALLRAQQACGRRHFEALAVSLLEGAEADRAAARDRLLRPDSAGVPPSMVCAWPEKAPERRT
ncbi:MAG: hypothetical protein HZC37_10575 [Burkholderiales bacterium]|nr:hypothetical protein [Burkholderiales bacterium]